MTDSRKITKRYRLTHVLFGIALLLSINTIGTFFYYRLDLTSEKRYSLSPATREMLGKLDDIVYFKVYLEGDFPSGFRRLQNETREMLDEFRAYSDNIQYEFVNPSSSSDKKARESLYRQLMEQGLNPTDLQVRTGEGMSRQIIFPGAIVSFKNREISVDLLKTSVAVPPEQQLNNSVESLEYTLASVIKQLSEPDKPKVGYLLGQGEMNGLQVADMLNALSEYYTIEPVTIGGELSALTTRRLTKDSVNYRIVNKYKALIVAKPDSAFTEKDKFIIDQFIMRGGKVLWMVDPVYAEMDSLQTRNQTIGITNEVNLSDFFFNYGVRLNNNLLLDISALPIPIVTGRVGNQPKTDFLPWYFFPVVTPSSANPVVSNLNAVKFEFAGTLDTLDTPGVRKTILLTSSKYSRLMDAPALISLDLLRQDPDPSMFNQPFQPMAVLLEGNFVSLFLNRVPPEISGAPEIGFVDKSPQSAMIVIADGDVMKSQIQAGQNGPTYLPAGYDRYTGQQFGNRDLVLNAMNYLCDDSGLISVRSRQLKLRVLDTTRVKAEETKWQLVNTIVPVVLVLILGGVQFFVRKYRYSGKR